MLLIFASLVYHLTVLAESVSTVDQESLPDTSTSRFTWKIESISKHNGGKLLSDVFVVGGYSWSVNITSYCLNPLVLQLTSFFYYLFAGECWFSLQETM